MNRKMRRSKKKAAKPQVKTLSYEEVKRESVSQAIELYSLATMLVLRDKLGFGQKRIERFNEQVFEVVDSINTGYITKRDIEQVLLEECKIRVK